MNSLFSVYWLFAINCLLKNFFCLTSSFWSTTWNLLKIQRFKMWILAVFPTGLKIWIQSVYIHLGWGHQSCGQGWAGWGAQSQFLWNRLVYLNIDSKNDKINIHKVAKKNFFFFKWINKNHCTIIGGTKSSITDHSDTGILFNLVCWKISHINYKWFFIFCRKLFFFVWPSIKLFSLGAHSYYFCTATFQLVRGYLPSIYSTFFKQLEKGFI